MKKLTDEMILSAQKSWADGILKIGNAFRNGDDYRSLAEEFINNHYGYREGVVLFKPTLASIEQFRETFEKALSYFISGNPKYPEDQGFAIKHWVNIKFENTGIMVMGHRAVAMGNYYFTDDTQNTTKVEYTFGYFINGAGEIKINLHHSSIPYSKT
ncbi:MAG: hypothetical protein ACOC10_01575 [Bacteroidota bacterium]